MDKFSVTISVCVQIGVDTWKQEYHTHAFYTSTTMEDVLAWAETFFSVKKPSVNDLTFSEFYE